MKHLVFALPLVAGNARIDYFNIFLSHVVFLTSLFSELVVSYICVHVGIQIFFIPGLRDIDCQIVYALRQATIQWSWIGSMLPLDAWYTKHQGCASNRVWCRSSVQFHYWSLYLFTTSTSSCWHHLTEGCKNPQADQPGPIEGWANGYRQRNGEKQMLLPLSSGDAKCWSSLLIALLFTIHTSDRFCFETGIGSWRKEMTYMHPTSTFSNDWWRRAGEQKGCMALVGLKHLNRGRPID